MSFDHALRTFIAIAAIALATSARSAPSTTQASTDTGATMDAVDLRPFFSKLNLSVRSQGPRNTCSVFTVTDAVGYALAKKHGHGSLMSVEYMNWALGQSLGTPRDGGFFSDIWKWFFLAGMVFAPKVISPISTSSIRLFIPATK